MTVLTRRGVKSVLASFAIMVAACGSSNKSTTPSTTTSVSSTTTSSSQAKSTTTTTTAVTTTTSPQAGLSIAVWPTTASGIRYDGPVAVARAFALNYLHFVNPLVGQFQQGDARSGEVPIRTTVEGTALGPVTTVIVRQIDGAWWVLGAATPNITLTQPATLATISSPVRLRGTSTAFEATVNVSIRQDAIAKPLVESFLMGGSNGQMGPFNASFTFARPTSSYGAIVLYTISSANGHVAEATVIRVRLSST
jgi:Immunoglobulin-like domain of bacterial spore germination